MSNLKINTYSTEVGPNVKVTIDKKSGARVISFPFEFPDGTDGIAIVCKMTQLDWKPSKEIERIVITFKEEDNEKRL
jgi:hypothetical protein